MTYKPRLHHFTRLLMSVAVGLSFTGCGNSSNGGSTGSSFEQVPLIGIDGAIAGFEGVDYSAGFGIETTLQSNGTFTFLIGTGKNNTDSFTGSWSATQTDNNIYQIKLSEITSTDGHNCTMTCKAFILTIPKDQLEDYRKGNPVSATLYVDFTHNKGGDSCPLNKVEIESMMTGGIQQFIPG